MILVLHLAHDDPQEQRVAGQLLVGGRKAHEDLVQDFDGGTAIERPEKTLVTRGHEHRITDRATSLGDNRVDRDVAGECDSDQAGVVYLLVEEEGVAPRLPGRAGKPANLRAAGVCLVEVLQERVGIERERIRQQEKLGLARRRR